jgi:hypothetical protein
MRIIQHGCISAYTNATPLDRVDVMRRSSICRGAALRCLKLYRVEPQYRRLSRGQGVVSGDSGDSSTDRDRVVAGQKGWRQAALARRRATSLTLLALSLCARY